jgi:DNA-directed RNA polymerase subunit RPC12/RpoP
VFRTHEMRKTRTEESGREEWACPTCGRRILLRWPPDYEKQIVEPGDQRACHVGSSAADAPALPDTPLPAQQVGERQWNTARRWLRETGVDALPAPPSAPPASPRSSPSPAPRPTPPSPTPPAPPSTPASAPRPAPMSAPMSAPSSPAGTRIGPAGTR